MGGGHRKRKFNLSPQVSVKREGRYLYGGRCKAVCNKINIWVSLTEEVSLQFEMTNTIQFTARQMEDMPT